MLLKIAFRNIFRQKRRTVLTCLTMTGGFILLLLSLSIAEGTYGNAIDLFTTVYTGHVQINPENYLEKPSLYNTFSGFKKLSKELEVHNEIKAYSPRVYSTALSFVNKKTTVARIIGVYPKLEEKTTQISKRIKKGSFLDNEISSDVVISGTLSEILKAEIGSELVMISQAADGSIANDIFYVKGIMKNNAGSFDRASCYMHAGRAQEFLFLHGRYHEIKIVLDDYSKSREVASALKDGLDSSDLEVKSWQQVNKTFYEAMQADKRGNWIALSIIMLIVGIGVLNTVLMTVLERTREFGVLKALGTRPFQVFSLIITETLIMALFSVILGALFGTFFNYLLVVYGWDYPVPVDVGGFVLSTMHGTWKTMIFIYPLVITLSTAAIVSVFPGIRAMRILPVKAMRIH
jgi:ABC-type lipoprotein release transport system permease subunit